MDATRTLGGWRQEIAAYFPDGQGLPPASWRARHLGVLALLALHVVGLAAFALARGFTFGDAALEVSAIVIMAAVAAWPRLSRRARSSIASAGLVVCSAVLVHVWAGTIEAHFHFFVMLGVIALYEDWVPYFIAVAFVAVHHGAVGTLFPVAVFSHPDAFARPWRWAVIHATFVLGLSVAILTTWRVSEHTRSRLRESEGRFRSVVENAPNYIITITPDGTIRYVNRTTPGLTTEQVLGTSIFDWVKGEHKVALVEAVHRVCAERRPVTLEAPSIGPHGAEAWYNLSVGPIIIGDEVTSMTIVASDVTDARRAQAERIISAERQRELEHLREVDRLKTHFINTAAHEFGTPLTPIKVQVHMLRKGQDMAPVPDQRHALDVLDRNVDRLTRLVSDVLEGARLQAGKLRLDKQRVDGARIAEEAAESFRSTAEGAGVDFDATIDGVAEVEADPYRLTQILYNLLNNAFKFTPPGGRVGLEVRVEEDVVRFTVRDTGAGLRPSDLPKLFQPFSQVHDTMQQTRAGTGLGLYICRGIVEEHGGRIWCESPGLRQGSEFHVELPRIPLVASVRRA